jgi:heme-degrading monooxygenase HmoA
VQHAQVNLLTADPVRLGEAIRYLEEKARPLLEELPGNQGMSVAANELGVAVVETFWVSHDAMREHEKTVAPTREEAARLGGGTVSAERLVVASFTRVKRPQPGAGVRLTRMDTDAKRIDEVVAGYEDAALPWLTETPGFVASLLFIDRSTGRSISETQWKDPAALAASRSAAAAIRADMVAATGSSIRAVEEYSLIFDTAEPA